MCRAERLIASPALHVQVGPQLLSQRLREEGSAFRHHLPDDTLLQIIQDTCSTATFGRMCGHRVVAAALSSRVGVRALRAQVLRVQQAHDPAAHHARRERVLHRGTYTTCQAMMVWHIDGAPLRCMHAARLSGGHCLCTGPGMR